MKKVRHGGTVLLIEDNPDHAEFALRAFRNSESPMEVVWVKDGQEALELLQSGECRPDLILLDVNLARVHGHEVLRRVKSDPKLRTIPVVMLSTSDRPQDVGESYRAGANSYVNKPVSFQDLVQRVTSVKDYWLTTNQVPIP